MALNCLEPGAVVLARIPFAERNETKVRPAIVVHATRSEVIVRPVTTSVKMRRGRGGTVQEIVLNQQRCWIIDRLVQIPAIAIVALVAIAQQEVAA